MIAKSGYCFESYKVLDQGDSKACQNEMKAALTLVTTQSVETPRPRQSHGPTDVGQCGLDFTTTTHQQLSLILPGLESARIQNF